MTDQCKHCTIRGDIKECLDTGCSRHEDWWAVEVLEQLKALQEEVESLEKELDRAMVSSIDNGIAANLQRQRAEKAEQELKDLQQDKEELKNRYNDAIDALGDVEQQLKDLWSNCKIILYVNTSQYLEHNQKAGKDSRALIEQSLKQIAAKGG